MVIMIHSAARMSPFLVALIQREMFVIEMKRVMNRLQMPMLFPNPALCPVGFELIDHNSHGYAGVALAAIRAVNKAAAAAITLLDQLRINLAIRSIACHRNP